MNAAKRREGIISMLKSTSFVKMSDIASHFNVSNETARRDLDYLQDQQLIRRVYGGAILRERSATSVPVTPRSKLTRELSAIGKAAAELVGPGEAIFLGNGSTTLQVARHLRGRDDITVVTNSLAILNELADENISLIAIGGTARTGAHDINGDLAGKCVNHYYCDKAIFGCGGVTKEFGLMDYNRGTAPLHSYMIRRSSKHILVTGSHKFGAPAFISACSLNDVDVIITDDKLPEEYETMIREAGIRLILVKAEGPDLDD